MAQAMNLSRLSRQRVSNWIAGFGSGAFSGRALFLLAAITLITHELDLLTGIQMIQNHGLDFELNPIARNLYATFGPGGLFVAKLGVVAGAVAILLTIAHWGRVRLAFSCLVVAALLGLIGLASNMV